MRSAYLSRSLFGSTRMAFITAALFVGTLALAGNVGAQEPTSSQRPIAETPGLVEAAAGPGSGTSATCLSALTLGCRGGRGCCAADYRNRYCWRPNMTQTAWFSHGKPFGQFSFIWASGRHHYIGADAAHRTRCSAHTTPSTEQEAAQPVSARAQGSCSFILNL